MSAKASNRHENNRRIRLYAVMAQRDGREWISGVFARLERAQTYVQEIPEGLRPRHKLTTLEHRFPLFALEDCRGFRFFDKGEIVEAVSTYRGEGDVADKDYEHAVLYVFQKAYRPQVPGADEMGAIWHWHITNERLAQDDSWLLALVK